MNYKRGIFLPLMLLFAVSLECTCLPATFKGKPDTSKTTTTTAPPSEQKISPVRELKSDIDAIFANPDFSNALVGVSVLSLEAGEYFYKRNDTKNFIPASTLKLLTTAAALKYLGKDFQFTTSIYLDGKKSDEGEFVGNIIIRGGGDPTLSSYFYKDPFEIFDTWLDKFDSLGIRSIRGNIIGDDDYFDDVYYAPGWAWDDMIYPYSAEVSALTINDNIVEITVKAGEHKGDAAIVSMKPRNSYLKIINNIKTVPQNETTDIQPVREPRSNLVELFGSIALDSTKTKELRLSLTVENPTLFFLNIFKEKLEFRHIRFRGSLIDFDDWNEEISYPQLQLLYENQSPPLAEIISIVNKVSHNLGAEMILKTIGKEMTGTGSFSKGIEQVLNFASKNGISPDNISVVDGSGLSRLNLISPAYQIALLSAMYRSEYKDVFINSLATPGSDGTLLRRMTSSRAETNVWAKTGTMNGISCICGYVRTRDEEMLAFSIMIMNFTVPQSLATNLQDLICMRLASFTRKGY